MALRQYQDFTVERLEPHNLDHLELLKRAAAIQAVLAGSWGRLIPDALSSVAVRAKVNPADVGRVAAQADRLRHPSNTGLYFIGYDQAETVRTDPSLANATALVRVEPYQPRIPFLGAKRPFTKPYPNITDMDAIAHGPFGPYKAQLAAGLHWGLEAYDPHLKMAAYVVNEDIHTVIWLHQAGMYTRRAVGATETVEGEAIRYSHLEAHHIGDIQAKLVQLYPQIREYTETA